MKNKKGFTLIELLAIIVVLAIIALITVPVILNVIEHAKKGAATDSAYGYKEAVNKYSVDKATEDFYFTLEGEYSIMNGGNIANSAETHAIAIEGEKPLGGYVVVNNGYVSSGCIQINEYAVTLEDGMVISTIKGQCNNLDIPLPPEPEQPIIVEEFPQIADANPGIICGDGQDEGYDSSGICYIYSVEDLVEFSAMVNSGKDFSGKTVMLMNNLDIQNNKSYVNPSTTYTDINGNGQTESLKTELTSAKGYEPIGSSSSIKFAGTFEGNTKKIKNLLINYSERDYVGLFGYNSGTIKGLQIENATVTGNNYIGVLTGTNTGTISSTIINGNVTGKSYLGIAAGQNGNTNSNGQIEAITSGTITGTGTYAGGGVGNHLGGSESKINIAYISGSITQTSSRGKIYGSKSNSSVSKGIALDTITLNDTQETTTSYTQQSGYPVSSNLLNHVATLDYILDTYVGGDNNNDGYYYDYDANGAITLYSTTQRPLTITMAGDGTSGNPYQITTKEELRQVAYDPSKSYILNADINLTGTNPILLSNENYKFTGTFDGNLHTISNGTMIGTTNIGLFGYNSGTIKGLKLENMSATGMNYIGALAGTNAGTISSTIINGNVTGKSYLGIAAGQNGNTNSNGQIEAITSGTITGTGTYAGGGVGTHLGGSESKINIVYISGSITQTSLRGKIYGDKSNSSVSKGIALDTITLNDTQVTSTSYTQQSGYPVSSDFINHISTLDYVLDTYVGGDENNDGYYYDYGNNGITLYSTTQNPLTITMNGAGTPGNPYQITTKEELRQVAYDPSKSYILNADINLTGTNPILLSNENHKFTGTFDGNLHTISNGTMIGTTNIGLFGYNSGTIKGLKLENMSATGIEFVGVLAGTNAGTISSTIINGNVTGKSYLGIAAGQNGETGSPGANGQIEAITSGTILGTGSYAGGGVGKHIGGSESKINIAYISGSITQTSLRGKIYADKSTNAISKGVSLTSIEVNGAQTSNTSYSNTNSGYTVADNIINHISTLDNVLDTYVGGDDNNDGYYYDYGSNGITLYSTSQNPLTITMSGSGTSESPYIINSYEQLKQAAFDQSKYYRLNTDIDLINKNPITLATKVHPFTGTFDGYAHTISNGTIIGQDDVGLFGYNSGTIKGLKLNNMSATGNNYVGILVGKNVNSIQNVLVNGTVSAKSYTGIIAGQNGETGSPGANGQILGVASGTVVSLNSYAGGVVGKHVGGSASTLNVAFISGSITSSSTPRGKIYGDKATNAVSTGISLNTATSNGSATTSSSYSSSAGKTYSAAELQTSAPYQEIGLNFTDTNVSTNEYIWSFSNNNITFNHN